MPEIVDVTVVVHHRTEKAVLVSTDGERESAVWLPLSAIEIDEPARSRTAVVTLPERLAIDKGLV